MAATVSSVVEDEAAVRRAGLAGLRQEGVAATAVQRSTNLLVLTKQNVLTGSNALAYLLLI